MTNSKLLATAAIIALTSGSAFAETTKPVIPPKAEVEAEVEAETTAESIEQSVEETAADAAAATENAVEETAEAAGDAAESVEQTAENAVEATGDAIDNAAQATENAVESAEAEMTEEMKDETVTRAAPYADFEGMTVGDLLGLNVYGTNDEDVGEVDYIVRDGDGLSAVVGVGGFLGLGEYTVAIPLEEFSMATGDMEGLKLSAWTEEELRAQPEFDESGVEGLEADVRIDAAY